MDRRILSALKRHHEYDAWRDRTTLDVNLFVWQTPSHTQEIPGWELHRAETVATTRPATRALEEEAVLAAPRVFQSIWRRPDAPDDVLLSVDQLQCDSRAQAHELVVQLLGEFQSTLLQLHDDLDVGDVAFSPPGNSSVLVFARANLVLLMRNAGRELVSVVEEARQVDQALIARPEPSVTEEGAALPGLEVSLGRRGAKGKRSLNVSEPDEPLVYKFFSQSGEVRREGSRLVYQSSTTGEQVVDMYALTARTSDHRSLRFDRK